jgi:hypothetical protein
MVADLHVEAEGALGDHEADLAEAQDAQPLPPGERTRPARVHPGILAHRLSAQTMLRAMPSRSAMAWSATEKALVPLPVVNTSPLSFTVGHVDVLVADALGDDHLELFPAGAAGRPSLRSSRW